MHNFSLLFTLIAAHLILVRCPQICAPMESMVYAPGSVNYLNIQGYSETTSFRNTFISDGQTTNYGIYANASGDEADYTTYSGTTYTISKFTDVHTINEHSWGLNGTMTSADYGSYPLYESDPVTIAGTLSNP